MVIDCDLIQDFCVECVILSDHLFCLVCIQEIAHIRITNSPWEVSNHRHLESLE